MFTVHQNPWNRNLIPDFFYNYLMTPLSVLFVRVARLDRFHLSTWTGELVGISNFSWPAKLTQRHQWNVNETFVFQFQVVFPIIIKKSNLFLPKGPTKTKSVLWLHWLIPLEGLCNALPRMMIICVSQLSKLWLCQNQLLPCRVITNARRSECYEKMRTHERERGFAMSNNTRTSCPS